MKFRIIFLILLIFGTNNFVYSNDIVVESDLLEIYDNERKSIFKGSVYAKDEKLEVWSQEMVLKFFDESNKIKRIYANNNVTIFDGKITATGENAIYDLSGKIVKMTGNIHVKEGGNILTCDELTLDLEKSTSIMKSNTLSKVRAVIINNNLVLE